MFRVKDRMACIDVVDGVVRGSCVVYALVRHHSALARSDLGPRPVLAVLVVPYDSTNPVTHVIKIQHSESRKMVL